MKRTYTTEIQVRAAFWRSHPKANRKLIRDSSGRGTMYTADTRCAFVDFMDYLSKNGDISPELAERVTLC